METNREKDWRKSWQEQLENYSVTPPPEVWEELSEELTPRVRVGRRAILWAAAACIALLVGTFVGLQYLATEIPPHAAPLQTAAYNGPDSDTQPAGTEASKATPLPAEGHPLYAQSNTPSEARHGSDRRADTRRDIASHPHKAAPAVAPAEATGSGRVTDETVPTTATPAVGTGSAAPGTQEKSARQLPGEPRTRKDERVFSLTDANERPADYRNRPTGNRSKGGWTVGLSMGNNLITAADNRYGFGNLAPYSMAEMASIPSGEKASGVSDKSATPYQHIMLQNINARPTTDVKHHFPISVGVTVQKSLTPALALETGLVYTYLASDLTAGDAAYYTQKQQLHYLGIPVKLNWNFLRKRYFNLYLTGGGMVEKCIYGELSSRYEVNDRPSLSETDRLHVDPLQWSVSAAAGISFKLASHINLYAEPGVVYYFDDGSHISTIRKEKPFNINLQAGLRFDF